MSEMHLTKTEPVLRWQTKEELQRWKTSVDEEEQRRRRSVEEGNQGSKREREIQADAYGKEVKSVEANEGKHRRTRRYVEQLKDSEQVKTTVDERGVRESNVKLIPTTSQEKGKGDSRRYERAKSKEMSLEFGCPVPNTTEIAEAMIEKNNKLKDAIGISNRYVEGGSFVIHRKEEAVDREEEVEVEEPRREETEKVKGRMKEEIKRIKEENRRINIETHSGRVNWRRVSEVEDNCNNNERSCVGEETMSVSISEDTVSWLLENNRRALTFIQEHCKVSMNVPRKRGDGRRIALISGSLRDVSRAGEIVKLDAGQPHLVLTDVGANRLRKDKPRVEER